MDFNIHKIKIFKVENDTYRYVPNRVIDANLNVQEVTVRYSGTIGTPNFPVIRI